MRRDEETGRVFDLFFNRVMFPIRDRRGRTISFGGRILGDGQPKYVNGPETALFSKRRTLYGLDLAREAVRRGGPWCGRGLHGRDRPAPGGVRPARWRRSAPR
jgi:DNA primase